MTDDIPQEIRFSPAAWEWICANGHDGEILDIGEDHGMAAVIAWLDERNLEWSPVVARRVVARKTTKRRRK